MPTTSATSVLHQLRQQSTSAEFESWRPDVVMFDLDGTLIDTMGGFADLAATLIEGAYGLARMLARRRYLATSGVPFRQQLELIFPGDARNDPTSEVYERRKIAICAGASMAPRTVAGLQALRALGLRLVVSSNSAQHFVDDFAQAAPVAFDRALGFGAGLAKGEPHVATVMAELGVSRDQLLFVGDSLKDGELARACGQRFVGVVGTFAARDFERAFPGVTVVDNVDALAQFLEPIVRVDADDHSGRGARFAPRPLNP